jgi:proteasome lid subunit RPN8/RPN11
MKISKTALREVHEHAAEGYPNEICGVLIANRGSDVATQSRRVPNTIVDRARDRYEMDVLELKRVERECDDHGLRIVGYYHTHPDHPAIASETDSARSWAGTTYLIVSCVKGEPKAQNAFMSQHDRGTLRQVPLEVVD